jgi:hypothetical protein
VRKVKRSPERVFALLECAGAFRTCAKKTAHRASTAVIPSENFMNQRAKEF